MPLPQGQLSLVGPEPGDPGQPGHPGPTVRVRMTVAYNGHGFHGFAAQPGDLPTVAGTLSRALTRRLGHPITLVAAGRTDAGVHARAQVVSFDAAADRFDPVGLQRSLNRALSPAVVVRAVEAAPEGFDARRWARSRSYRYTILNHPLPDPFLAATAWHVPEPLDIAAMRLACDPLVGEHDFTSFCRVPRRMFVEANMVRRVLDARWVRDDDVVRFEIRSSAFCHQMVRSIVGFMVAIGTGRRRAGEVAAALRARDRATAPNLAPAHGLCLWEVGY
ncbi:MAG TPA: tRNA pseudouridine(38-40) synthase TruA [Acidimicrobiales bacterium]|nr:tRNA pseudouridine(38-40) synthase TruA [Acidimicrobiales bacterium]